MGVLSQTSQIQCPKLLENYMDRNTSLLLSSKMSRFMGLRKSNEAQSSKCESYENQHFRISIVLSNKCIQSLFIFGIIFSHAR